MPKDRRDKFDRKVNVLLGRARVEGKAGKMGLILNEIAALVIDEAAIQSELSPQEKAAREQFREETGQDPSAA